MDDLNIYLEGSAVVSSKINTNMDFFNSFYISNHNNDGKFVGKTALLLYYKTVDFLSNNSHTSNSDLICGKGLSAFSSYCFSNVAILRSYDSDTIKFIKSSADLENETQNYTSFSFPFVNKLDAGLNSNLSNDFLMLSTVSLCYMLNFKAVPSTYSHVIFVSEIIDNFHFPQISTVKILFKLVSQIIFERLLKSVNIKLDISDFLNQILSLLKKLFGTYFPLEIKITFFDTTSNPYCRYLCLHLLAHSLVQFMNCLKFLKYGFLSDCHAIRAGVDNIIRVLGNLKEFEFILINSSFYIHLILHFRFRSIIF